jgi:hypothetical protein
MIELPLDNPNCVDSYACFNCNECINCSHCEFCNQCENCFNCFNCFGIVNGRSIKNYDIYVSGAYHFIINHFSKRFIMKLYRDHCRKNENDFYKMIGFLVCSKNACKILIELGAPVRIFPKKIL